jgi:hypothetical protein
MVKPINSGAPQPVPESPKKGHASGTNAQPVETNVEPKQVAYNDEGRAGKRAERLMEGQAQAAKLFAQLQQSQGRNPSVPTPYPNIANANQKTEPKK